MGAYFFRYADLQILPEWTLLESNQGTLTLTQSQSLNFLLNIILATPHVLNPMLQETKQADFPLCNLQPLISLNATALLFIWNIFYPPSSCHPNPVCMYEIYFIHFISMHIHSHTQSHTYNIQKVIFPTSEKERK